MDSTPPLPPWIRDAEVAGYRTAHQVLREYGLEETRLFGTESLYGDWNADTLLLAKDFAPTRVIHERVVAGEVRPYRHAPRVPTNVRLRRYADGLRIGEEPATCGLLYGSALGNLLRKDGIMSGTLPNRAAALAYGRDVLRFTMEHMPNLRTLVCMGEEAWKVTARLGGLSLPWTKIDRRSTKVQFGGITAVVVSHPAARWAEERHAREWARVADELRRSRASVTTPAAFSLG